MAATQKSNVEFAEEQYEAFNRGDVDECLAGFADDITWTEPEGAPMIAGTHHGPDEVLEHVFTPLIEHFDAFEVTVDRLIDGGDTVVMEGALKMTTAEGEEIIPTVHVIDVEGGNVQEFTSYADTARLQKLMA